MNKREFELPIKRCPFCGSVGTCKFRGTIHNIPYFGETMETLVWCENCRIKHSDVMHLGEREPSRYEYEIKTSEDMSVRVVRSSTGFVEIPELGVSIRPGPASEGFISNVEGVLNRVKDAVGATLEKSNEAQRGEAREKLEMIEKIRGGEMSARLIISDPFGHSAIIHKDAKRQKLAPEDISKLT